MGERQLWHQLADTARRLLALPPELRGPFKCDEAALRRIAALGPPSIPKRNVRAGRSLLKENPNG